MILAATVGFGYQMAPSPVLEALRSTFALPASNSLLNLSISIVWPPVIIAAILTGKLIERIGIYRVNTLAMILMIVGAGSAVFCPNYASYLAGRIVYGFGFGLVVSFMGAAIMQWFAPKQREVMNTLNGIFPFLGLAVCFNATIPVFNLVQADLKLLFALWALPALVGLVAWVLIIRSDEMGYAATAEGRAAQAAETAALANEGTESGLYTNLLRRREIIYLCLIFVSDFFCVQYIAAIMPAFFVGTAGVSDAVANLLVGLFFPIVGIAGAVLGGILMARSGRRRPILIASNLCKFFGIVIIVGGSALSCLWMMVCGLALFAIGNSIWMPVLYTVILELDDMTPARSAAAFALTSSAGYVAGFLSPLLGGALTDLFAGLSNLKGVSASMFGYTWSMALFSLICSLGLIASLRIRETGPGR
jgi:MFS family permease